MDRIRLASAFFTLSLAAVGCDCAIAQTAATAAAPVDYNRDDAWLCRPGRQDACAVSLTSAVVPADALPTVAELTPAADPPIDCFYVYPTVSLDPGPNSDMVPGPEEQRAAQAQFAAFGRACRLFAPIYRQTTVATLLPNGPVGDRNLAYADVLAAWQNYLARDNRGRGVVLIGHSQGAMLLADLVAKEIDGKPAQSLLVSAIIPGTVLAVPTGKDVGASFQHIPLCRAGTELGCAVAYSTYRADNPPPPRGYFGVAPSVGLQAACVNPAALAGGKAALGAEMPVTPRVAADLHVNTTFIALPGLVSGECVTSGNLSYLAVSVGDDRRGPLEERALEAAETTPGWGLHILDVDIVLDDLVGLVKTEGAAWVAAHPK